MHASIPPGSPGFLSMVVRHGCFYLNLNRLINLQNCGEHYYRWVDFYNWSKARILNLFDNFLFYTRASNSFMNLLHHRCPASNSFLYLTWSDPNEKLPIFLSANYFILTIEILGHSSLFASLLFTLLDSPDFLEVLLVGRVLDDDSVRRQSRRVHVCNLFVFLPLFVGLSSARVWSGENN